MRAIANPMNRQGEKNIFCPEYDSCLDFAVESRWESWDCGECKLRASFEGMADTEYTIDGSIPYYRVPNTICRKISAIE